MKDKNGFELTQKQRETYFGSIKMLYGSPSKAPQGIVPPRVSMEDMEVQHFVPPNAADLVFGFVSTHPGLQDSQKVPRRTKPKAIKEWREQAAIYKWTQKTQLLRGFVMKFDNEGKRSVVQSAVAKRMGLLPGTSDLFIARPIGGFHGLWLEVKQDRQYTASERAKDTWKRQEAFQARMRSVGFATAFCFGADDGIGIITRYLDGTMKQQD